MIVAIIFGTTSFIACSLALYKLGWSNKYLNMLAFFGCIKLGLWTPYVLTVFADTILATVTPPTQVVPLLGRDLTYRLRDFDAVSRVKLMLLVEQ